MQLALTTIMAQRYCAVYRTCRHTTVPMCKKGGPHIVSIFGVRTLLFETILLHGSFIDKISPPDRYAGSPLIAVVSSTTIDRARPAVPCFSDINRNRYRRLTHKLCHETWLVIKKKTASFRSYGTHANCRPVGLYTTSEICHL